MRVMLRALVFWCVLLGSVASVASVASAQGTQGATQACATYARLAEQIRVLPSGLIHAIALAESSVRYGRKSSYRTIAWPWTLNIDGKGHYFPTRAQALAALEQAIAQGASSVDVGCMQLNVAVHGGAFASLDAMLEPRDNVAYATQFLLVLHDRHGDWNEAIRYYHSSDSSRQKVYHARVESIWRRLLDGEQILTPGGVLVERQERSRQMPPPVTEFEPVYPQVVGTSALANSVRDLIDAVREQERLTQGTPRLGADSMSTLSPSKSYGDTNPLEIIERIESLTGHGLHTLPPEPDTR